MSRNSLVIKGSIEEINKFKEFIGGPDFKPQDTTINPLIDYVEMFYDFKTDDSPENVLIELTKKFPKLAIKLIKK
jgi:hypothetical protein